MPYTPGGSADLMARAFGAHINARSGRSVVVDNRPGAAGTIGTQSVARSAPNGETILQSDMGPMSIQPAAGKPGYGAADFLPIARLVTDAVVLAARADGPFTSLAEVVRRAKADPGGVSYATPGILSHLHVAMERFAQVAGIELTHVPYGGTGPGVVAVLAGQVNLIAVPPTPLQDQSAQLRPLAVASEAPLSELSGCRRSAKAASTSYSRVGAACSRRRARRPQWSPPWNAPCSTPSRTTASSSRSRSSA